MSRRATPAPVVGVLECCHWAWFDLNLVICVLCNADLLHVLASLLMPFHLAPGCSSTLIAAFGSEAPKSPKVIYNDGPWTDDLRANGPPGDSIVLLATYVVEDRHVRQSPSRPFAESNRSHVAIC